MSSSEGLNEEKFLKCVKDHVLTIIKDDGVYRHIRMQKPHSIDMHYEIITYPGGLVYRGDMGSYCFERTEDMFKFFRDEDGELSINSGYWEEKVTSASVYGDGVKEWSSDRFESSVSEVIEEYIVECPEEEEAIRESVEDQIYNCAYESDEWSAVSAIREYSNTGYETHFNFDDFFCDNTCMVKTYHYIWCLYAIVHAINEYDKLNHKWLE